MKKSYEGKLVALKYLNISPGFFLPKTDSYQIFHININNLERSVVVQELELAIHLHVA